MVRMRESKNDIFENLKTKATEHSLNTDLLVQHQSVVSKALYYSDFIVRVSHQYCSQFINLLPQLVKADSTQKCRYNFDTLQSQLSLALSDSKDEYQAFQIIREFRQLNMLKIAWHDFQQNQSIEESLTATSQLANILINAAYAYVYEQHVTRYGEPENKQQLLIIGMGKLGGNELNFSSDIDLIFAYPTSGNTLHHRKPIEHQVFFIRLAQKLIKMLDQTTQDGRVFRVDMRLRPMGESGPLVLPFAAFESYYMEQGRQWERFAMQKMRIINDTEFNDELEKIITPFVYRKYVDFTTLDSIREMKHLIETEVRRRQITNNIKLGKGGIREVEFFIQSLQLIHAGRDTTCQVSSILLAMEKLEAAELLSKEIHQQLRQDYLLLRKVEHYLQAFNDEQTQTLPALEPQQQKLCQLLGCESTQEYLGLIDQCTSRINDVFASLVEDANKNNCATEDQGAATIYEDIWHVAMNLDELQHALNHEIDHVNHQHLSKQSVQLLHEHIVKFRTKTERGGVSARGLKSINKLLPLLLQEFDTYNDSFYQDQIVGVFNILNTILGRVTYLDLLLEHPDVRKRLYLLCKKSPWISEQISQYPLLLDELLHPVYLSKQSQSLPVWKAECADDLRQIMLRVDTTDIEAVMDRLREFKHVNQLRISAADISGTLAINQVSDRLTVLAEVLLEEVIAYAWQQVSELYGAPQGNLENEKSIAVIAYGKFGGLELSYGSDLDLVFLHNADLKQNTDESGTRKQISNQEFYIKLVQRICHICTTKTYNGILYEIDLRLRPSGNSGLLVSHIESFYEYQQSKAWTWEHQALVRSRAVCATHSLLQRFNVIRNSLLNQQRDPEKLRQEVADMRNKMRQHLHKKVEHKIDLKQAHGGIVDIEFMVQYWILANTHQYPKLSEWSDNLRLLGSLQTIGIIDETLERNLVDAYLTIRHASHRLQLAKQQYARQGKKLSASMSVVNTAFKQLFE